MSRLYALVEEYCPCGVEFVQLSTVIDYQQPTKYIVEATNYDDNFKTPVLTAGQTFILGYTNEADGIYNATEENPTIIFDDFTTSFHWVDFDFKIKSSAMKILRVKSDKTDEALFRYIYHCMKNIDYKPVDHSRQWIAKYSTFKIPLPPVPVQAEIVRILDNFTELTAELTAKLTAELTAKKDQYKHYRDRLLTFDDEVEYKTLNQISKNLNPQRKPVTKSSRDSGIYPYYGASGVVDYVKDYIFDGDFLLISEDGANLIARTTPIAFSACGKIWVNNHAHILEFSDYVSRRFVEIYLNSIDLNKYISAAAQPKLTKENLNKIPIPYPDYPIRKSIIDILDRFGTLCNDISQGLPAEIKAREEQYEYYRNKLLTFKEKED